MALNTNICYNKQSQEYLKLDALRVILRERCGLICEIQNVPLEPNKNTTYANLVIRQENNKSYIEILDKEQRRIAIHGNAYEWVALVNQLLSNKND